LYFHRGHSAAFYAAYAQEEGQWKQQVHKGKDGSSMTVGSFEEYRNAGAAGL